VNLPKAKCFLLTFLLIELYRSFNCREQATVPSGTLPSALSSKSRDDFGGYFRFSLKQEMRARNDLDLRARLYLFHLCESISKPTSLPCFGWMKSIGTVTLLSSARASQVRIARSRRESTSGLTDEIADLTPATSEGGASRPTSNSLIALAGGVTRKQKGDRSRKIDRSAPRIGLVVNPAQITNPLRLSGLVAAH
jgi:hypothetical protein